MLKSPMFRACRRGSFLPAMRACLTTNRVTTSTALATAPWSRDILRGLSYRLVVAASATMRFYWKLPGLVRQSQHWLAHPQQNSTSSSHFHLSSFLQPLHNIANLANRNLLQLLSRPIIYCREAFLPLSANLSGDTNDLAHLFTRLAASKKPSGLAAFTLFVALLGSASSETHSPLLETHKF